MNPSPAVTEWLFFVAHVAAKTSLLLLALLAADLLLPRRWGAWRSLLWRTGLIAVLLLPVLMPVLPRLEVPLAVANLLPAAESSALPSLPTSSESPAAQPATPASAANGPGLVRGLLGGAPWAHLLLGGYAAGLTAALMVLVVGWWRTTRQAGSALAIADATWDRELATYRRRLGIKRQVRLGTGALPVPLQIGIVRPHILLPATMVAEADPALVRTAIIHELIHVRRLDFAFNLVAGLALALYWCNPLVWLAVRRLRDSAEQACDDWSVELLGRPERYCSCLLEAASRCARRPRLSLSASMARRPRVAARIERIAALAGNVSPRVGRRAGSGFTVAMALASSLLAASGSELAAGDGDHSHTGPLRPAAEQAEGVTVAGDGSVSFTQDRFELYLRPMTAEELIRLFSVQAQGGFQGLTVFRLGARNYYYPKVYIDPTSIVLRSADGREWRSLAPGQLDRIDLPYGAIAVFAGQEATGYVAFKALDADVRDIQVTVKDVVLRFNYLGEPIQTMDFTYRFVR